MDAREAAKKFDHAPRSLGEKVDDRGSRKRRRPESESSPRRPSKRSLEWSPVQTSFSAPKNPNQMRTPSCMMNLRTMISLMSHHQVHLLAHMVVPLSQSKPFVREIYLYLVIWLFRT